MAFRLNAHLEGYEYRGRRSGSTENGAWLSLVLENTQDCRQLDVSVPRDMHNDIYEMNLEKGDLLGLDVVAYAGNDYSRVSLVRITSVVDSEGEVQL